MTPIADMVETMIARGVAPDLIVLAVRAAEMANSNSTGIPVDKTADKRRAWDRERKAMKRNSTGLSTGIPPDTVSPLNIDKKERTRAERLPPEWKLSDQDRVFALSKGMSQSRCDHEAEKFRNYWTAKSGRSATKLDWSATWRNWVLSSLERNPVAPNARQSELDWRSAIA